MERNVYISIRGLHQMEDEDGAEENVEIVSPGEYFVRNGKQYVTYQEILGDGQDSRQAVIKLDGSAVYVARPGRIGAQIRFEAGKRNMMVYGSPFGVMELGVTTKSLQMEIEEHNWSIHINYILDIDSHFSGEHEVHIEVQDGLGEQRIRLSEN